MTDVSQVPDADLLASLPMGVRNNNPLNLKGADGQFRTFPSSDEGVAAADQNLQAYGTKHGINTVSGVINRWAPPTDGNNTGAYAAHVANRMGVDPNAPVNIQDPATRQQMLGAMAEFENGAPVLSSPKGALSQVSDADLLASLGHAPPAQPPAPTTGVQAGRMVFKDTGEPIPDAQVAAIKGLANQLDPTADAGALQRPFVQRKATDTFKPGQYYINTSGKLTQTPPGPNGLADTAMGLLGGSSKGMGTLLDQVAAFIPGVGAVDRAMSGGNPLIADPAHATGTLFQRMAQDYSPQTLGGKIAHTVGTFLPAAAVPGSIPQRVANVVLPGVGSEAGGQVAQAMGGGPIVQQLARTAGALAGGGLASVRLNPSAITARQAPMTLDQVKAAKDAAYAKVDASGFKFPQPHIQGLADDIAAMVADKGGPSGARLYPAGTAMSDRISALANQPDGVPLTQLDSLRSDIYGALVKPGDREAPLGVDMRAKIDDLINGSNAPNIADARDLNTRLSKMQTVTDKLDSAGLRSASTYSGGNYNNAVRQNLRPLVDPTSSQQIRNLTPDEQAALRTAVQGTPVQNLTRYASKFLTNKFVQVPASLMTHGIATPIMEAGGAILNRAGEAQTGSAVQKLVDLMAAGGKRPVPAAGAQPLLSAPNTDAMAMAALLSALPAMSSAKSRPPQRKQ